jgi:hypothetical protein
MALTKTQRAVLLRAYRRPYHTVCPTPGLWAASQTAVIRSLVQGGYITGDGCPVLTEKGKAVAAELDEENTRLAEQHADDLAAESPCPPENIGTTEEF